MIEFHFNIDEEIYFIQRHGSISKDDILTFLPFLDNECSGLRNLFIFNDTRDSVCLYDTNDLFYFTNMLKAKCKQLDAIFEATITNTPYETALSYYFETLTAEIENYNHKTFSTPENALKWLRKQKTKLPDKKQGKQTEQPTFEKHELNPKK